MTCPCASHDAQRCADVRARRDIDDLFREFEAPEPCDCDCHPLDDDDDRHWFEDDEEERCDCGNLIGGSERYCNECQSDTLGEP
jgi:hypothetical protein